MATQDERRRFTRIDFDATARLQQGEISLPVHIIDISVNGVLLETPSDYSINMEDSSDIVITLSDDAQITMKANLVHSSSDVLGFKCISMDMESATLLRRLIELNMDDENATERVLEELLSRS
ncbi:Cyclic diguanosine monophosphate-binding protein [Thalassocella blandensis]|nr:Cyclic diguanosine monophosphate-binding protein [Thalassocella blandensis]